MQRLCKSNELTLLQTKEEQSFLFSPFFRPRKHCEKTLVSQELVKIASCADDAGHQCLATEPKHFKGKGFMKRSKLFHAKGLYSVIFTPRPKINHVADSFLMTDDTCSVVRGHSSITSSKRWVGGVRKWQFLMIYSTVNHQRGGWVGLKKSKT